MINREYSQDKQHKTAQFRPQTTELFGGFIYYGIHTHLIGRLIFFLCRILFGLDFDKKWQMLLLLPQKKQQKGGGAETV